MIDIKSIKPGDGVGGGRFSLIRILGRGGMGEVWLARDQRLEEMVALKFLPPELALNNATVEHLRFEVARSHRLSHPNIIRLHDLHEPAGEAAFISMEYVDGPSLNGTRLERSNQVLSWDYLRPVLAQFCSALAYAHAENVIHRDLKPDNLLIDSRGRLKLTDFGVAAMAADLARLVRIQGGGTLEYMSPQQVEGKHPQVTDDIYSLGATLYELLTGSLPFVGGDVRERIRQEAPEPLRRRLQTLGIHNDVPAEVEAVVMSCLAKAPDQRPQDASAIVALLGLSGDEAPNAAASPAAREFAPPASEPSTSSRASRGKMPGIIAAIAVLLALVLGGVWHFRGSSRNGKASAKPETNPIMVEPATNKLAAEPTNRSVVPASGGMPTTTDVAPSKLPAPLAAKPPRPTSLRWTNSLGMIFNPIPGSEVMFCIWKTRVQDYQEMVTATGRSWEKTSFNQGPTHPAVNIQWEDAMEFCSWLTQRERAIDWLGTNQLYRLPTDLEWSLAVGLVNEKGNSPKDKDNHTPGVYPWGRQWPPPRGIGNFDPGLNVDDYLYTSPVGVFPANQYGLYDMAGNAREWCGDLYSPGSSRRRVVRGSSWFDTPPQTLESSRRAMTPTERHDHQYDYFGFRCALVTGVSRARSPRAAAPSDR